MSTITTAYRGRFAPTPSGPLHLGSLLTALASWLAARKAGGAWLLRIDDLDRPRCVAGAQEVILRQLEAHGLYWDGTPVYQAAHEDEYRSALAQLGSEGRLYACTCTRALLATSALPGPDGPIYPGTCRHNAHTSTLPHALRFRAQASVVEWVDGVQGLVQRHAQKDGGDFVLRRADGQIGYHLACALDEERMGITDVVRGADLLGATTSQLQVLQAMGFAAPRYAHVPVLQAADGRKLSKQNGADALETSAAAVSRQLFFCLNALQLPAPMALSKGNAVDILKWALQVWPSTALP